MVRAAHRCTLDGFSREYDCLRCRLARRLAVLSGLGLPTPLQRRIPSLRGSATPRSPPRLARGLRNIERMCIACPLRVRLSSRLTLIRLTWFRNPWAFGVSISILIIVTHAYIFFSGRSSIPRGTPSALSAMLPYRAHYSCAPSASAAVLMPAHHPRGSARPVSCYALFE
jgi:hypothetical protein